MSDEREQSTCRHCGLPISRKVWRVPAASGRGKTGPNGGVIVDVERQPSRYWYHDGERGYHHCSGTETPAEPVRER